MATFAALIYGFLASFVLSAAGHNNRIQRPHSPALLNTGYVLCGLSIGAALALACIAIRFVINPAA